MLLIKKCKAVEIVIPLKYLSTFSDHWKLINYCKIHLELSWTKDYVTSNIAAVTIFKIKSKTLYVPIVTLSIKDVSLTSQLNEGFKRLAYWYE